MALRLLQQQVSASLNPSYLTGNLPGGAGAVTAGTSTNPGISSPFVDQNIIEVFDVTAPTTLTAVVGASTAATPAIAGKLLILDANNSGPGGWKWKQASTPANAPYGGGQYGIVYKAANANVAGVGVATTGGNIANPGDKALVCIEGPIPAFCQTTVGGVAMSAGMPLASDGAGNLTPIKLGLIGNTTTNIIPPPGAVLATSMDFLTSSISTPVLRNVYVGGY